MDIGAIRYMCQPGVSDSSRTGHDGIVAIECDGQIAAEQSDCDRAVA